jgi:hypothetical protein
MARPRLWIAMAFVLGVLVGMALMYPINVKAMLALPPAQSGPGAHP